MANKGKSARKAPHSGCMKPRCMKLIFNGACGMHMQGTILVAGTRRLNQDSQSLVLSAGSPK